MIYFKSLFNKDTYKEKISSITNLRFVSFQLWKWLLLIVSLLLLKIINHIFIVNLYITYTFSLSLLFKLFLLGIGIDYIKLFLFKNNQNQNGVFERIVKLFLVPSQSTFAFFFLLLLSQANITSIKSVFAINSALSSLDASSDIETGERESEGEGEGIVSKGSDFTLMLCYSLISSFQVINQHSFYKWPKLNKTRIDCFKAAGKKSIKRAIRLTRYHIIIGAFYYIMKANTLKIGCDLLIYSIVVFYNEIFQYILYNLLKGFICSPINPDSNEIKNELELISYPLNFSASSSFIIIHYLNSLNETLLKAYYQPKLQLNPVLMKNNSVLKEIKYKIDFIYSRLNEKMKIVYYSLKQQSKETFGSGGGGLNAGGLISWFDFSKNEIFEYETSPEIIDIITEVIYTNVLLLSTEKHHDINRTNGEEINQNEVQYYIVYLIDRLFAFEKVMKELRSLIDSNSAKSKGMAKISNLLSIIILKIQMRVKSIVYKNLKDNFIINYSESVQEIIKQFRI